jgi:hypothetical protein
MATNQNTATISNSLKKAYRQKYGLRQIRHHEQSCACLVTGSRKCMGRKVVGDCHSPRSDHASTFKVIRTGEIIMVQQPYFGGPYLHVLETTGDPDAAKKVYDADVAELTAECQAFAKEWGLSVRLSIEESWHAPGHTILVEYRKGVKP